VVVVVVIAAFVGAVFVLSFPVTAQYTVIASTPHYTYTANCSALSVSELTEREVDLVPGQWSMVTIEETLDPLSSHGTN
jgi:hypothetical protein